MTSKKIGFVFVILVLFVAIISVLFFSFDWIERFMYPVKYEHYILDSSSRHNVDPYLVAAIIRVESNFKPHRTSPKNAAGLMQIMPETAKWIVTSGNFEPSMQDKLEQPEVNIELGVYYLSVLSKQFSSYFREGSTDSQIALIAASYNAGPGNLMNWLNDGTWNGAYEDRLQIPFGETRHYIQRVHYYYEKYRNIYNQDWKGVLNGKRSTLSFNTP